MDDIRLRRFSIKAKLKLFRLFAQLAVNVLPLAHA